MTFLELCQHARRESRLPGTGPTTVLSQTGRLGDVVAAVRDAWTEIQLLHYESWTFMQATSTAELIPGRTEFTFSELGAPDAARVVRVFIKGNPLQQVQWFDLLREQSNNQYARNETVPSKFAVSPNGRLLFSRAPEDFVEVTLFYVRKPETLTQNAQVPSIGEHHRMGIVWKAVMDLSANESDTVIYQKAFEKYESYLTRLEHDQLPPVTLGGTTFS